MADRYWVGGSGNWSDDDNHWATSSGGEAGDGNLPTSADNAIFDANSGEGTVTVVADNTPCLNFDASASSITTFGQINSKGYNIYGNFTLKSGISFTSGYVEFYGTGTHTITTNGVTINFPSNGSFMIRGAGGTYTLQDNLTLEADSNSSILRVYRGTFDSNEKDIICGKLLVNADGITDFTNSYITCNKGSDAPVYIDASSTDIFTGSTIKLTGTLTAERTVTGGGKTFGNFWNATSGPYAIVIAGSNTFNDFKIDAGRSMKFTDGTTQTVTSLTATGTADKRITLTGTSTGGWTISDGAGTNSVSYCTISYSTAQGGATWDATGAGNINGGNNTGWNFPAGGKSLLLLGVG